MPPRLDVVDVLETDTAPPKTNHGSLMMMHTSKNDAPKGERRRSAAIIRSMDLGFPPEASERSWGIHLSDAFETYKTSPSPTTTMDRILRFSPGSSIYTKTSISRYIKRDQADHLR
jgi:hypothetical protein